MALWGTNLPTITSVATDPLGTRGGSGQRSDRSLPTLRDDPMTLLAASRHRASVSTLQKELASQVPFEGFDFVRPQDPSTSAKDAFAHAVKNAPPPPGEDKQALGMWFDRYIRPQMEAFGHQIHWVRGDKMSFTSQQGTFTVDYLRGAGASGWAVAWQVAGAASGGGMPGGVSAAYQAFMQRLVELVSPDAEREEMEAAIRQAAEETGVRYDEVYKESIRLPGIGWIDLVGGYGGANASWQWLVK